MVHLTISAVTDNAVMPIQFNEYDSAVVYGLSGVAEFGGKYEFEPVKGVTP